MLKYQVSWTQDGRAGRGRRSDGPLDEHPMDYDAAIVDLDGTVYLGDSLVPGADDGVRALRDAGVDVLFLTNKAIERRGDYCAKLGRLGIDAAPEDVVTSGWVTARYVADRYPHGTATVIGERPLIDELADAGVETTRDAPGDLLVVSMDRAFDYGKLELALRTLDDGSPFLATNPDRTLPVEDGAVPGAGGMIGAVEGVTGREPDRILGKPSATMIETAFEAVGADPERCLLIGDRLDTDIEMGERAGATTVLVLSGVTDEADLAAADATPDHVLDSLADVEEVLNP